MNNKASLDYLLHPKSVAIVGASPRTRTGTQLLTNARRIQFAGSVMPVNPRYAEISGYSCYPSLKSLPEKPDCVVVLLPAQAAVQSIEEAGALGIPSAIIIGNGFSDAQTEEGRRLQRELVDIARRHQMAVAGPNCLGLSSIVYGFANTYTDLPQGARPGGVSLISQSGGLMNAAAAYLHERGAGMNYLLSGGNHAVVDIPDYIDFLADDPNTTVIAIIMEGVNDGLRFRQAIERASPKKPIVVLKLGQSTSGKRATLAHTGTLAGSEEAYATLFRQNGVAQAASTDDLMETALLLASVKPPTGDSTLMMTISGGTTGMIADLGESAGLRFPQMSPETNNGLQQIFGVAKSLNNPIDTTGWAQLTNEGNMDRALDVLLDDDGIDIIALAFRLLPTVPQIGLLRNLQRRAATAAKPIIVVSTSAYTVKPFRQAVPDLNDYPILEDLEKGQRAISRLVAYGQFLRRREAGASSEVTRGSLSLAGSRPRARATLTEYESKSILRDYGMSVTRELLARDAEEAIKHADLIGYPVALKIQSPEIIHKSDAGGVVLNVDSASAAREAYARIMDGVLRAYPDAALDGVLVQEMVPAGVEMILGMTRDEQLGPMIICGLGGVFVEIVKDVAIRFPPLSATDARSMIDQLKASKLLHGYRGSAPCDIDALVDALQTFARFVEDSGGNFDAIDINPLIVGRSGHGVCVADAVMVLSNDRRSQQ